MIYDYLTGIENYEDELIEVRRLLHQNPEVSFKEFKTSQYIYDAMIQLEHAEVIRPTPTSVLVKFITNKPGRKIGLRADIDALGIQEERDEFEFKSKNEGVMHACGHDGHTSILMAAAKWFNNHFALLSGEIYCIFQHAEEIPPGGAQEIIATGVLDDLDFIYGQHLLTNIPFGLIDIKPGPNSSNSDLYYLRVKGKGGHASQPNFTVDPVLIGCEIVDAVQHIVSRKLDPLKPAVVSNTLFQAGDVDTLNIIPDSVLLGGSVRTLEDSVSNIIKEEMEQIIAGICQAYGADFDFKYQRGYRSIVNDLKTTKFVKGIAEELFPQKNVELPSTLVGEDFSAYSRMKPSTFAWIGTQTKEGGYDYPHHHPKFALDERALIIGLKMFIAIAVEYTNLDNPLLNV